MTLPLSLSSTRALSTGFSMPLLGFGVYQNYTTLSSVLEAFKAGYRYLDLLLTQRDTTMTGYPETH